MFEIPLKVNKHCKILYFFVFCHFFEMAPPFLRELGYPWNHQEILQVGYRRGRRRSPAGSNDQKGNYHNEAPIPKHIVPSPTKRFHRYREFHSYASTPKILVHMEYWEQNFHHGIIIGRNWNNYLGNLNQSYDFQKLMKEVKSCNLKRHFILLEERETWIRGK